MQTTCTSLQTDNQAKTSSLNFYGPDALPDDKPTITKTQTQQIVHINILRVLQSLQIPAT